jgi:hypothetical protein
VCPRPPPRSGTDGQASNVMAAAVDEGELAHIAAAAINKSSNCGDVRFSD